MKSVQRFLSYNKQLVLYALYDIRILKKANMPKRKTVVSPPK